MDISAVIKSALEGSPLILVIMGLVELLKKSGKLEGSTITYVSMGLGAIIGGMYMFVSTPGTGLAYWFSVVIYGLVVGLVASGVWDVAKNVIASASIKAMNEFTDKPK